MVEQKTPKRGDFIWLDFDPTKGHEQAGKRPALVLSQERFNISGLVMVCPITSKAKGYNTEILLPATEPVQGVILTDQVHTKDWQARGIQIIGSASEQTLHEVFMRIKIIMGI